MGRLWGGVDRSIPGGITKALRKGVTNWRSGDEYLANRLIGDHRLPEGKRITWTTAPYRSDGGCWKRVVGGS